MRHVIAAVTLLAIVTAVSPAEAARRWFRRATVSTCPNGQCYQPVAAPVEAKMTAQPQTAETTPVPAPANTTVVSEAPAVTYLPTTPARRVRVRWFRR